MHYANHIDSFFFGQKQTSLTMVRNNPLAIEYNSILIHTAEYFFQTNTRMHKLHADYKHETMLSWILGLSPRCRFVHIVRVFLLHPYLW